MIRVLGAVLGGLVVVGTSVGVLQSFVIPRGRMRGAALLDRAVDHLYWAVGRSLGSYERRDRILASQPAAYLMLLLAGWLASYLVGFTLLLWPWEPGLGAALGESGSSLFTLGFDARHGGGPTAVDFVAAAAGLTVIALQIAYLPSLYGSYNRRETEVTLLAVRAGEPAWGPELLARTRFGITGTEDDLPAFYASWERWAAEVAETHSSYPVLLRFRSPAANSSWLVGLLAVLDSAALYLAVAPSRASIEARMCLRMGYSCLRALARTIGLHVDDDPHPDGPLVLTYADFLTGYQHLTQVDFAVERSPDEAWPHFRGWRVTYEQAAYLLAYQIDAVPALWSGPRRIPERPMPPIRPSNRTPDRPSG
ncbi:MAG: hypothetical protein JO364_08855 [Pseudonocardiales bacterium]|nr:hypothetical protein [Pseudonocardiales bacterium]MBV9030406.1 hypothetical protein [Pseudonocardiales bacterium]